MRILLVQPGGKSQAFGYIARLEPLGLEMIAAALDTRHEVTLLDLRLPGSSLSSALDSFRPALVGISSSFTTDLPEALRIARAVKEFDPRTAVIVGGHHPSLCPSDFCDPAIDAIVQSEGEQTTRELVECLCAGDDLRRVPGLVLNREGGQVTTARRALLRNLDELPMPRRAITVPHRSRYYILYWRPLASVETARGCPYRCNFCSVWRFYQGPVRFKSAARVVAEVEAVQEGEVFFTDDNFLFSPRRAREIALLIKSRGLHKRYGFQARSDAIANHPDLIALWSEIGLRSVFIGFEKTSTAGLAAVNKHNTVENNERALEILRAQGVEPMASFIVDPQFTEADFHELRDYVLRFKFKGVLFTVLTPLPGTTLFEQAKLNLTTRRFELFDLGHAVTSTSVGVTNFYQLLSDLYIGVSPPVKRLQDVLDILLYGLRRHDISLEHWQRLLKATQLLTHPGRLGDDDGAKEG